jgi:hypothetical protein
VKHGIRTYNLDEKSRLKGPFTLDYIDVEVDFSIKSLHDLRFMTLVRLYKRPGEAVKVILPPTLLIRLRDDDILVKSNTQVLRELNADNCYFLTDFCTNK